MLNKTSASVQTSAKLRPACSTDGFRPEALISTSSGSAGLRFNVQDQNDSKQKKRQHKFSSIVIIFPVNSDRYESDFACRL